MRVVVGPGLPAGGHPGGVRLGVEGARGGIGLVRRNRDSGVAVTLEERTPRLIGLVPVARGSGVVSGVRVVAEDLRRHQEEEHVVERVESFSTDQNGA